MGKAKRVTERTAAPFRGSRVDREAGTIDGVLICGTTSANGRDYPAAVLRRDHAVYEGRPVNCDHGREATVDRRIGWFSQVAPGDDGRPRGRLNLLKSHPLYGRVMEAAERNPGLFGFSHVAMCETRFEGGREVVESIKAVESIDLVADPATTNGLFESRGTRAVAITVKEYADKLAAKCNVEQLLKLRRLVREEDMGAAPMAADAPPADAAETTPDDGIDSAFISAATAELQECMDAKGDPVKLKKCLKKLKKLLVAHGELSTEDADDDGDADAETEGDADAAAEESKGKGKGKKPAAGDGTRILEALDACGKAGFRPDRADLDLLAASQPEKRAALIDRLKKLAEGAPAERPTSATRTQAQAVETRTVEERARADAPPAGGKEFAKWVSD